jgi:hypothetical protein
MGFLLELPADDRYGPEEGYEKKKGHAQKEKSAQLEAWRKHARIHFGPEPPHRDAWAATGEPAGG